MDNQNAGETGKGSKTADEADNAAAAMSPLKKTSSSVSSGFSVRSGHVERDDPSNQPLTSAQEVSGQNQGMTIPPLSPVNPAGYDPNRIPSSIFASKPANPGEWSVTSNESLFSIHMGNNSFSKDSAFVLYKSGELLRPDEMGNSPPTPPVMRPVAEAENMERKNVNTETVSEVREERSAHIEKIRSEKAASPGEAEPEKHSTHLEKTQQPEEVRNSSSSTQSFKFPVLESNMAPGASVKVTEKNTSQRQLPQQPPDQSLETTPKNAGNSWFSCFSCCSLGR